VAKKYKELKEEADENGCDEPPKLIVEECVELILDLLKSNPATIIIDALDECDPARRHELLQALEEIIQGSSNVVNVFVSSRDDNDLVCRLEGSPNVAILVRDNNKDIKRFIASQVDRSIKDKRLLGGRVSEELKNKITKVLSEGAQGM
jgi:selenocysteine-specific translation elongation factor